MAEPLGLTWWAEPLRGQANHISAPTCHSRAPWASCDVGGVVQRGHESKSHDQVTSEKFKSASRSWELHHALRRSLPAWSFDLYFERTSSGPAVALFINTISALPPSFLRDPQQSGSAVEDADALTLRWPCLETKQNTARCGALLQFGFRVNSNTEGGNVW